MLTKHILVPLDESKAAEVTFNDAAALARALEAEITLLEVVQPLGDVIKTQHRDVCIDKKWPRRVRRAVSYLLSVAERPAWKDIPVRAALAFGEITETITNFARSHSIDLIVWPPISLGETALQAPFVPNGQRRPQGTLTEVPFQPNQKIFEQGLIHNEMTGPWVLENATVKLSTICTGG